MSFANDLGLFVGDIFTAKDTTEIVKSLAENGYHIDEADADNLIELKTGKAFIYGICRRYNGRIMTITAEIERLGLYNFRMTEYHEDTIVKNGVRCKVYTYYEEFGENGIIYYDMETDKPIIVNFEN